MMSKISDAPSLVMTRAAHVWCVLCHLQINADEIGLHWRFNHKEGFPKPPDTRKTL